MLVRRALQGDGENETGIEIGHLGHHLSALLEQSCTAEWR
jgi:hypothetical protein